MTCRYGKYYITCHGFLLYEIKETYGFIVNEEIGFSKDENGYYVATDIETGMAFACYTIPRYSLIQAYKDAAKYCADNAERIAACKSQTQALDIAYLIKMRRINDNDTEKVY